MNNKNYIRINPHKARQENLNHQLNFFGYNFVGSSMSSSTKVGMTMDSSTHTETSLSLNVVTKPAPGVVPNLCGILKCSRCKNQFAVYDIKKFFRSARISNREIHISELFVFPDLPSLLLTAPIPLGYSTETELFLLVTSPLVIMQPVPKLQLS